MPYVMPENIKEEILGSTTSAFFESIASDDEILDLLSDHREVLVRVFLAGIKAGAEAYYTVIMDTL